MPLMKTDHSSLKVDIVNKKLSDLLEIINSSCKHVNKESSRLIDNTGLPIGVKRINPFELAI